MRNHSVCALIARVRSAAPGGGRATRAVIAALVLSSCSSPEFVDPAMAPDHPANPSAPPGWAPMVSKILAPDHGGIPKSMMPAEESPTHRSDGGGDPHLGHGGSQ